MVLLRSAAALAVTAAAIDAATAAAAEAAPPAALTAEPSHRPSDQAALEPAVAADCHAECVNRPLNGRAALELVAAAVLLAQSLGPTAPPPMSADIYYHRELLTRSLDGRRCVLTSSRTLLHVCMHFILCKMHPSSNAHWVCAYTHVCASLRVSLRARSSCSSYRVSSVE